MGGTLHNDRAVNRLTTPVLMLGEDGSDIRSLSVDSYGALLVNSSNFSPTGMYVPQDIDVANDTKYYGYVEGEGRWYIMKEISSAGSFRFTNGTADYATAWTARATHTYTYFDLVF